MREEELRIASGAQVEAFDLRDAGLAKLSLGGLPEVEVAALHDPGAEKLAVRLSDLLAHFVAAGPDRGPDRGGDRPAKCLDGRAENAVQQPDPARMDHADRGHVAVRANEGDRQAVGGERQNGQLRLVSPQAVPLHAAPLARLCAMHERGVNLVVEREPARVASDLGTGSSAGLLHAADVVAPSPAGGEGGGRGLADGPTTRRGGDPRTPRGAP